MARLNDDRMMVIEYKGALLAGGGMDDTNDKRAIGGLWEQNSGGMGRFVMVEKPLGDRDVRGQLQNRNGGSVPARRSDA